MVRVKRPALIGSESIQLDLGFAGQLTDSDHPATEADPSVQARPGQITSVPAAGVSDVDTVLVVADADEPVALTEPTGAVHQQRALIQPCLQLLGRSQRSEPTGFIPRLARRKPPRSEC